MTGMTTKPLSPTKDGAAPQGLGPNIILWRAPDEDSLLSMVKRFGAKRDVLPNEVTRVYFPINPPQLERSNISSSELCLAWFRAYRHLSLLVTIPATPTWIKERMHPRVLDYVSLLYDIALGGQTYTIRRRK